MIPYRRLMVKNFENALVYEAFVGVNPLTFLILRPSTLSVNTVKFLLFLVDVCLEIHLIYSSYDLLPKAFIKILFEFLI